MIERPIHLEPAVAVTVEKPGTDGNHLRIARPLGLAIVGATEDFGVKDRGAFYETAGCLRDVIENHLFQVVPLLAMEPPYRRDFGAVHGEKAKVLEPCAL